MVLINCSFFSSDRVVITYSCVSCPLPDVNGLDVNPAQDTPVATRKEDTYIHFSVDVEIQRHVEKLPKGTCTNIILLHGSVGNQCRTSQGLHLAASKLKAFRHDGLPTILAVCSRRPQSLDH